MTQSQLNNQSDNNVLAEMVKSHYKYALYEYDETSLQPNQILETFETYEDAVKEMFELCKGAIGSGECEYFDTPEDLQGDGEGFGDDQWTLIAQYQNRNGELRWAHWGYEVARIARGQE
jgi:hypothetical protein